MSAQPVSLQVIRTVHLALAVTEPEVVVELERRIEGHERDDYATHALRIGVLALRQASGAIDVESIRRAGNDVIGMTRELFVRHATDINAGLGAVVAQYFDPKSGALPQRLEQLVKGDGDLERLLAKHLEGDRSTIHRTLDGMMGNGSPLMKLLSPDQAGGIVASMREAVDAMLTQQRDEVLRQFSLDTKESALSRLVAEVTTANGELRKELTLDVDKVVKEFSLDNDKGALSRLVGRVEKAQKTIVEQLSLDHDGSALQRMSTMLDKTNKSIEKSLSLDIETSPLARLRRELVQVSDRVEKSQSQFQSEVREVLATLQTRKQEAEKSPKHGNVFEDAMEDFLSVDAQRSGDVYARVGKRPSASGAKTGDHLITLGPESAAPGVRLVVESKAAKKYTESDALDELQEARKNREAQVGIFVFKRSTAPGGLESFRRIGTDILTVWDAEDPTTDVFLRAALSVGRALAIRERDASEESKVNLQEIERAVREIEKQVKAVEDIAKAARAVQTKGSHILEVAEDMKVTLEAQIESLRENLDALHVGE